MSATRIIVGLMSGTSVDAIDAAVVRIGGRAPRLTAETLGHVERRWSPALRKRILAVMAPASTTTEEICRLNVEIAEAFAAAALAAIARVGLNISDVTALASHGQTVCHLPPGRGKAGVCGTLQLGDPSVIAARTGITTVGNFRPADMAVGGQGAPLVPWADAALLSHRTITRCVQNLGGIGNVTFLPALGKDGAGEQRVIAFDTGPANMLIDAVVGITSGGKLRFDRGGRMAGRGVVIAEMLRELQGHAYFRRRPPKSTGREEFGRSLAESMLKKFAGSRLEDVVATVTRLTAWSVVDAYARYLPRMPEEIVLCGGGADNPVLVGMIAAELAGRGATCNEHSRAARNEHGRAARNEHGRIDVAMRRIDEFGIPNKAKEAASFALLGAATLDGAAANIPAVTGARRGMVLGVVAPGKQRTPN